MNEDANVSTPAEPTPPSRRALSRRAAILVSIAGILAVVGLAVALSVAFQDSDSEPRSDLDRYFDDVEPVLSSVSQRAGDGDTAPLLAEFSIKLRETSATLDNIEAPDEVGDTHSALIETLEEEAVFLESALSEDLEDQTSDELSTSEREELIVILGRVTQLCSDLRSVAEENGIEVELGLC